MKRFSLLLGALAFAGSVAGCDFGVFELNLLAGNGPWADTRDTLEIQVRGGVEVEVPVRPYYTIENASIEPAGNVITASFDIGSVDTSREVEYVGLYVSTTSFVDRANMAVRTERPRADIASLDQSISLAVQLNAALASRGDAYARIGVKTVGVDELLFTPVERVTF